MRVELKEREKAFFNEKLKRDQDLLKILEVREKEIIAPLFWSNPIGGSEPDPGCSVTTISLYQNHLSKTRGSITYQLA